MPSFRLLLSSSSALLLALAPAAGAQDSVPLWENLGSLHHPVRTSSPVAQRYFDQGLRLTYGFNHEEAVNSFRQAARLDPRCVMCRWGAALALGPNINAAMEPEQERQAVEEVRAALALLEGADPAERAYVEALAKRYLGEGTRAAKDSAFAAAMRELAWAYPADADAAVLFAEAMLDLSPWDQWAPDGTPKPGTEEVVATLERVLAEHPDHPGACHYYIHTVEASLQPERALPCAERLPALMPGAGHLVHMPAHVYIRMGDYARAVEANEHAAHADERYLADRQPRGVYPFYYAHNLHFLFTAALMEGRSAEALRAARQVAGQVPPEVAVQVPYAQLIMGAPYFALVRFGRWDQVLAAPAPDARLRFAHGLWRWARGMALAATGRAAEARAELDSLEAIAAATPPDLMLNFHRGDRLLEVAAHALSGEVALRAGRADEGIGHLRQAVELQDGLRYDEPAPWPLPERQALAAALLAAGRAAEAEAVYREDLRRNPNNGWSLFGLAEALKAQGKDDAEERSRFVRAWQRADYALTRRP